MRYVYYIVTLGSVKHSSVSYAIVALDSNNSSEKEMDYSIFVSRACESSVPSWDLSLIRGYGPALERDADAINVAPSGDMT